MDLKLIIKLRVRVKFMALIVNCSYGIQSISVKLLPTSSEADVARSLNLKLGERLSTGTLETEDGSSVSLAMLVKQASLFLDTGNERDVSLR